MLKLDATTKSLEIRLAGAVASAECPFYVSYVEADQATAALTAFAANDGTTSGATAVTVIAAPAAGRTRKLDYLSIINRDTATVVLTVQVVVSGTARPVQVVTLAVGDNLSFTDAGGWRVLDAFGRVTTGFPGYVDTSGTPTAQQLALFTDADTITGDAGLTYNATTDALSVGGVLYERNRSVALGQYTPITDYDGSWFTAAGSMTVTAVTVTTFAYALHGSLMTLFWFFTGTLGGTASTQIRLRLPVSALGSGSSTGGLHRVYTGGVWSTGYVYETAGTNYLTISLIGGDAVPFTLGTFYSIGELTFPVNV